MIGRGMQEKEKGSEKGVKEMEKRGRESRNTKERNWSIRSCVKGKRKRRMRDGKDRWKQ